jgi:RelE-like toxin of type II toxin-antitoxin system HigB
LIPKFLGFEVESKQLRLRDWPRGAFAALHNSAYGRLPAIEFIEENGGGSGVAATRGGDELEGSALPGNRLEALKGNRQGQYSIRVNDQWRICFEWPSGASGPINVEIVDYH